MSNRLPTMGHRSISRLRAAALLFALLAPSLCLAQNTPAFRVRQDIPTGPGPEAAATGRVNDDAFVDLVVADDRGVSVLFGSAVGRFSAPLALPLPTEVTDLRVA